MSYDWKNLLSKPLTPERVAYWKGRLLTPLLGRTIKCRVCDSELGRAIFLVKRGGLQCLGLNRDRVRIIPCGYYRIEFECLNHRSEAQTLAESSPILGDEVVHVVLGHQSNEYLDDYLNYHQSLSSQKTAFVLVHGGAEAQFNQINWPIKTFCEDPSLRGLTFHQSFTGAIKAAYNKLLELGLEHRPVLFTESDVWALRPGYALEAVRQMKLAGADFASSGLIEVDARYGRPPGPQRARGTADFKIAGGSHTLHATLKIPCSRSSVGFFSRLFIGFR